MILMSLCSNGGEIPSNQDADYHPRCLYRLTRASDSVSVFKCPETVPRRTEGALGRVFIKIGKVSMME